MTLPRFPYRRRPHTAAVPGALALEMRQVSVTYPGAGRRALADINVHLPQGVRVALVGPNGAGKSTLLKTVAGLLPCQAGTMAVYRRPLGSCHHCVAYLPQRSAVNWHFPISVANLVRTGRYVHLGWLRRPGRRDAVIVAGVLERLGLCCLAAQRIGHLSGGQQQRVLLARALVQEADLLLLDEPLNARMVHGNLLVLTLAITMLAGLGTLGGNQSVALDVNNARQVTGNARTTTQTLPLLAFRWEHGVLANFGHIAWQQQFQPWLCHQ